PKLLERTGMNDNGSITAFYTVLVDGDDLNEPIADTVRGILDGHLVLDRKLAEQGHFPAINVLKSVSRTMSKVTTKEHQDAVRKIRSLMATYEENSELIQIGAYKHGSDQKIDQAIAFHPKIQAVLQRDIFEYRSLIDTLSEMHELLGGGQ